MIRKYDRTETVFNHNKNVLFPLASKVAEEANGLFEFEGNFPRTAHINKGDVISAPTPRGEQPFRVYRVAKTLLGKKVYARHRFYDLAKNFLIDVRPTLLTCNAALQYILAHAESTTSFTGTSDVIGSNTAYYVRMNPVQAIIGAENSLLNIWGGNLVRNNNQIAIKANGNDRGYEIRLGKNLMGVEDDSDESGIVTRLYPTVVIDQVVQALPEKYVDSPLINSYESSIIKEVVVELTEEQQALTLAEIYVIMRTYCNNLYSVDNVDKPVPNYTVNFIELSKTEQYKNLQILEQLDLYDLVNINVAELEISLKAKVIKYEYDCLAEKYISIELGGFSPSAQYQTSNIIRKIQNDLLNQNGLIASAIDYATNLITGNKGGYIVFRRYPDGTPYELNFLDTDSIQTAVEVIRINKDGMGFSHTGYNGPFETAIVAGQLVTGTGFFDSIVTNLIASDIGSRLVLSSNVAITNIITNKVNKTTTAYTFTDTTFSMKDSNGAVIIETAKGIANEQNFGSTQNVEDGYHLNMSFRIGDTVSIITAVEIRMKQYNFRTDSKGSVSGGGVKTTPAGGGSTSGASSQSTTGIKDWSGETAYSNFETAGAYPNDTKHYHGVYKNLFNHEHGMNHTHTTPAHAHSVDIAHGHTVDFGILETPNGNGTIYVDIDGIQRFATSITDTTRDITAWVTTNGVHNISLRSPNMKRIQMDLYIKSYIRR